MQARLHMRSHVSLSTAGSFKRHFANSLRTEHQCDCSARKLAFGRTYTGRSFLEEEQHHRVFSETKRLTHCAYFQPKPDLWRQLSDQAFLDSEASQELSNNELALFRASKTMTLNVLILRRMKLIFLLCCFPCFFCVMFSSEGNLLAATRWKWLERGNCRALTSLRPFWFFFGFTSDDDDK